MSRDPFEDNEQLPPWLRDLPLPPRPAGRSEQPAEEPPGPSASASAPAPQASEENAPLPDWLQDIGGTREPTAPRAEIPSWLRSETESSETARLSDESDISSWLRDAGKQAPAEQVGEDSLPSWLRAETPLAEQPPSGSEPLPSWLTSMSPEEPRSDTASTGSEEKPDWLRDLIDEKDSGEARALPDWLHAQDSAGQPSDKADAGTPPPPAPPPAAPAAESAGPAAGPAYPAGPADADEADIPIWLRDIPSDEIRQIMESGEEEISATPFSFEDTFEPRQAGPAADVPPWLETISQGEPSGAPGAAPDEEDVPSWLRDVGGALPEARDESSQTPEMPAQAEGRAGPAETSPQDAIPAWLQDMEPSQPAPGEPGGELPSWLRAEIAGSPPSAEEAPAWPQAKAPPDLPADDIPAWLQAETPLAPPPAAPSGPPAEELPPWLGAAAPEPAAGELPPWMQSETTAPAPADAEELPEWLRPGGPIGTGVPAQAEAGLEAGPPAAPAPPGEELPPWLRDDAGQPLPTAGAPGDANLPEWLRGETPAPPPPRAAPPSAAPDVPDWLRDEATATPEPAAPASLDWFNEPEPAGTQERPPSAGESEFFGGAELPAWLRTPEAEPVSEISPADARSLDWLKRLRGLEEESATVAAPAPKLLPRPAPTRTQNQIDALALLERLAANPFPEVAPEPALAQVSIWRRIGLERVLYVLLLVVLLAALAMPALFADLQTPPATPGAGDLFQQINALSDKDIVLVGYEWDARRISEMKPLEDAVIDQLIQKHVKLVLVSTNPQGTLLLFDLRDRLEAAGYRPGGEDYVLLGYKPGGELALRSFAQDFSSVLRSDFQGNDATVGVLARDAQTGQQRLTKLSDFSTILVLADNSSDVQGWMEQIHRNVPQVPLGFLLPAETAPIVQPYLTQAHIYHLAGKQGALAYQSLRGDSSAPAAQVAQESGELRLGILVFIGLFLIGAIVVGLDSAQTRRRKGS